MTIIEKIRAEIERLMDEYKPIVGGVDELTGAHIVLAKLISFLSTLESEKPSGPIIEEPIDGVLYAAACGIKNATGKSETPINQDELEEEIHKYNKERFDEYFPEQDGDFISEVDFMTCLGRVARHFAQCGAEHTPLPEDTVLFNKGVAEGKRLIMEEARNHFVLSVLSENHTKKMIELYNDEVDCKAGDVVRAIIFKKED